MSIEKKFQCVHCGASVECDNGVCTTVCSCGKVKVQSGVVIEGKLGFDYIDVSKRMILG